MSTAVRSVDTELFYLAPGSFVNRRFVAAGEEVNTGRYQAYPVKISDGRALKDRFDLDTHGFLLADHKSAARDFFDHEEVETVYVAEAGAVIKHLTGADNGAHVR